MPDTTELVEVGPGFTPLRYGLLSAAQMAGDGERWRMGVLRDQPACGPAGSAALIPCATGSPAFTPSVTGSPAMASDAFYLYAWMPCSLVGMTPEEAQAATQQLLTNGEARALEHVLWTGAVTLGGTTIYPHLAANTVVSGAPQGSVGVVRQTAAQVLTTGAPVDVVEAFTLLEGTLGSCYGGEGVIHVPRAALSHLAAYNLIDREGGQLRTLGGNIVAAYSPSDRTGPTGVAAAAGNAWFYATGAVQVYRGPINDRGEQPSEYLNREDNGTVYVVTRAYAATWDCCHLAAEVSLGGVVGGGAGGTT